ncbi:hypothetical protein F4604DRAFT_1901330 [Suillus subluteus]|nr:hypothetical protein F4604DRAFT_1901330 [Suillus subluteus]
MSMPSHEVLGSFADIPAVIRVDDASLDSTVSLSFLHDCNVPRTVSDHHGVAVESALGPVRIPTVDGWYNSRQTFQPVYLSGCDVELGRDWLASVNAKFDGSRFQRPSETDVGRLSGGHSWNFQLEVMKAWPKIPSSKLKRRLVQMFKDEASSEKLARLAFHRFRDSSGLTCLIFVSVLATVAGSAACGLARYKINEGMIMNPYSLM